jgi:hypothetical protein
MVEHRAILVTIGNKCFHGLSIQQNTRFLSTTIGLIVSSTSVLNAFLYESLLLLAGRWYCTDKKRALPSNILGMAKEPTFKMVHYAGTLSRGEGIASASAPAIPGWGADNK